MDWFRWHHGSVTDPKFQLVAKKAQASVAEVVAVWAFVLETASQNPKRGAVEAIDGEAIDLALGMSDGTTDRILSVMADRGLLAGGVVSSWEKRQPKREDDTAAERQRIKRQREHELALAQAAGVTSDASHTVTQCHAASRAVTPEEKREEKKDQKQDQKHLAGKPPKVSKRQAAMDYPLPEWLSRERWSAWIQSRNKPDSGLPLNIEQLAEWRAEGHDPNEILKIAAAGGYQGLFLPNSMKSGAANANRTTGGKLSAVEQVRAANATRASAAHYPGVPAEPYAPFLEGQYARVG